jgi:hypothetical protein
MFIKQNSNKFIFHFQILVLFCFLLTVNSTFAQRPDELTLPADSNIYYTDYKKLLAIQLNTQTRINQVDVADSKQNLQLLPNGATNLGIGASYYGIGIGLSLGLPKSAASIEKYGKTTKFDLQLNAYSTRFGFNGFIQKYKGYYCANPDDFMDWKQNYYPQIPDLEVLAVGASWFYIFNYRKFSYKAAYKHTAVQHKSAGSFVLGVYGYFDEVDSENGFVPQEFPDSIKRAINIKGFSTFSTGVSFGYMYTFVLWKNFILNLAALPGAGLQQISLNTLEGSNSVSNKFASQFQGRAALGYEHKSFYLGIISNSTLRTLNYHDFDIDISTGQVRFFVGKRFKL